MTIPAIVNNNPRKTRCRRKWSMTKRPISCNSVILTTVLLFLSCTAGLFSQLSCSLENHSSTTTATTVVMALTTLSRNYNQRPTKKALSRPFLNANLSSMTCRPTVTSPPCVRHGGSTLARAHKSGRGSSGSNKSEKKTTTSSSSSSSYTKDDNVIRRAIKIYIDYATRLWEETSVHSRRRIAKDKAIAAIRAVQHMMRGEEYLDLDIEGVESEEARRQMLEACQAMLDAINNKTMEEEGEASAGATIDVHSAGETDKGEQSFMVNGKPDAAAVPTTILVNLDEEKGSTKKGGGSKALVIITDNDANDEGTVVEKSSLTKEQDTDNTSSTPAKKKPRRSILFGAAMGVVAAIWVFSGNYIFTTLFTLSTLLGQLEYYRMVMNTGVYPARRISVIGSCAMFVTALFTPELHQICLPVFGIIAMVWFLTMRRQVTTIPEIATTFTGMFYLGYIPSFWVRTRMIGMGREPTRLAPLMAPILERIGQTADNLPSFIPRTIHLPITTGAVFIFWTWLCVAFSDVGAYFVGRSFGKTRLGKISPAAGATSPNKTVEGALGGCAVSAALGALGAWVQRWPYWYVTGPLHGMCIALLGLIGDLTASMLKRDAGLKDFGDILPEHGGIMDRVDSFIFTAPYSWLVCGFLIPALKKFAKARAALV